MPKKYRKIESVTAEFYKLGMEDYYVNSTPFIQTKLGLVACNDCYIITNPDGERYPCPKETFEATYEEVI